MSQRVTVAVSPVPRSETTSDSSPSQWNVGHQAVEKSQSLSPRKSRVSFGSSKQSLVETFIYDSTKMNENKDKLPFDKQKLEPQPKKIDKVRVTCVESNRPSVIRPPAATIMVSSMTEKGPEKQPILDRMVFSSPGDLNSEEPGENNPFRPEGDLSLEADPIIEMFKKRPWPVSPRTSLIDGQVQSTYDESKLKSQGNLSDRTHDRRDFRSHKAGNDPALAVRVGNTVTASAKSGYDADLPASGNCISIPTVSSEEASSASFPSTADVIHHVLPPASVRLRGVEIIHLDDNAQQIPTASSE